MSVKIEPGSEPIPGYKLIERLGGGGFGEVWKAEAPGGLLKAMKFVYGELGNDNAMDDDENSRAEQENTSLDRIKKVRHSYLLSVERIDIIENRLVITTELADRTTWDRFRECRNQGLPGIPRDELLNYLHETAEALDFLYEEHQLQHLDVKPQNLFLVSKHIKVADFGLVKTLGERGAATITGGVTPVYAAPETFDGWLSRYSDQYSLGIVYQELLTGQRPFSGNTMRQLILQHLQGAPDLAPLPSNDKPIIARALSKNPDERFPTCLELARALRTSASFSGFAAPAQRPAVRLPEKPAASQDSTETADATEDTQAGWGKLKDRAVGPDEAAADPPVKEVSSEQAEPGPFLPQRSDFRAAAPETPTTGSQMVTGMLRMAKGLRNDRSSGTDTSEIGGGLVQPSLVLGLGTLGLEALREIRRLLSEDVGTPDQLPLIRLLGIDTDAEAIQRVSQGLPGLGLQASETLHARLHRPGHYLKPREGKLSTDSWLNPRILYRIPRNQNAAGMRPLGRLAFTDNVRSIYRRLENELSQCTAQAALEAQLARSDLGVRSTTPRVYIVTCLAGNTGSGMFIDMAYLVRHLLRKQGFPYAEVVGVFLVPPSGQQGIRSPELANTYAALKELTYFTTGQAPFVASLDNPDPTQAAQTYREASPPFQRSYLVNLPEKAFGTEAALKGSLNQVAQFLYRKLATPLGKAIDALRPSALDPSRPIGQSNFQTFGLFRVFWPRRRLLAEVGMGFCKRLVQRWMEKKSPVPSADLASLAQEQWDAKGLRPESLIAQHQDLCERRLEQSPTAMLQAALGNLMKDLTPRGKTEVSLNAGQVIQAMDALEKLVGVPDECRPPASAPLEPGTIEQALSQVTTKISDMAEQKLAEFVVSLIEAPAYRLAGAEEALRQLSGVVERSLQAQEQLCAELQDRAISIYNRIHAILEKPAASIPHHTSSAWRITFSRKESPAHANQAAELLEVLKSYPKCRYQSLILQHINRLYVSLRGHVSDQIREVGFCRQRLGELAQMFDKDNEGSTNEPFSHEQALVPGGAVRLGEAARRHIESITPADLLALDEKIQELIKKDFRALVQICMGPGHILRTLAPAMLRRAEHFLGTRIKMQGVAEMFLERAKDPEEALVDAYDKAAPPVDRSLLKTEISLVVLPPDGETQNLGPVLRGVLPETERVVANRDDEILFYREIPNLPASAVDQLGPVAQEAYRQRMAGDPLALHTREDISDWLTPVPVS